MTMMRKRVYKTSLVYERWWWHQYLNAWIRDPLDGTGRSKTPGTLTTGKGRWRVWEINVDSGIRTLYREGG